MNACGFFKIKHLFPVQALVSNYKHLLALVTNYALLLVLLQKRSKSICLRVVVHVLKLTT